MEYGILQRPPVAAFKEVQHFSVAVKEQTFVVVDVENFDVGMWLSMAFVISRYPSGTIVAMEEIFVDRSQETIRHPNVAAFWAKNNAAFDYNMRQGIGVSEAAAEQRVCNYVQDLRRKTPHFFLVSDNPSFDVGILDNILAKNGYPPMSDRGVDLHAQVLDTWSYRLSLARIFNTKGPRLFQDPHVCMLLGRPHPNLVRSPSPEGRRTSVRHTPLHDCFEILASFFQCLDLANAIGSLIHSTLSVPAQTRRFTPLRVVQATATFPAQMPSMYEDPRLYFRQQQATAQLSHEAEIFLPQQYDNAFT